MTHRKAVGLTAIALNLLLMLLLYWSVAMFPRVEVAKNTQTVNHTYEPAKPKPEPNYGPPLGPGCKTSCGHGGGGTIKIGG